MNKKLLIDVRTSAEFDRFHRDGAINIPIENIMSNDFGIIKDVSKNTRIECYCFSGARADLAKNILNNEGYIDVVNLGGLY